MALAKCVRRCWDSSISRRYWPGDRDDIDPANPVAKHFQFDDPSIACTYVKPKTVEAKVGMEPPKAEPVVEKTEPAPPPEPVKFGDTDDDLPVYGKRVQPKKRK